MTPLLCIRHAESTMNAAGLWQGQADPVLSEAGRAQACALAGALRGAGLAAVVSSDLARARETAAIVGERLGLVPAVDAGLRELDVGAWSGLSHAEIARRWPDAYARFRGGCEETRPGGGETWRELRARVAAALHAVAARWSGQRVAVVFHSGAIRSVAPHAKLGHAEGVWLDAARLPAPERALRRAGGARGGAR